MTFGSLASGGRHKLTAAALTLRDGTVFPGMAVGDRVEAEGEVIFVTAMSGYQEVLTDPSYHGQIVVFTAAHIGNYGANQAVSQAPGPQVSGAIFHELWLPPVDHWLSEEDLPYWMRAGAVPALTGVDTRALTLHIREKGAQNGYVGPLKEGRASALARAEKIPSMSGLDLASRVTCPKPYKKEAIMEDPEDREIYRVAVLDFGLKTAILDCLRRRNLELTVWPASASASAIMEEKPQGLFLANGPGDPAACDYAIRATQAFLGRIPVFGICLGHQIMGLAAGAKTYKLPFGHHGLNHPVRDLDSDRVLITSQNHGFCVDPDALPQGVRANMLNLNDGTVEGLVWENSPAFCVQFHPEAAPGPHDSHGLFRKFRSMIKECHA
ncbi:MAG: glutamine-hydrolyzing carbamoyl-phosphate synthase small subunit [Deltaproteobacteria bacterium]|nr:glutamine-hydrolyzing carbamoyl-phosphate synthase small subunit [Deltaproteobacteria bacterium]